MLIQYLKYFYFVKGKCFGQGEFLFSFEGSFDYGIVGGGGGVGQVVGVGEFEFIYFYIYIYFINGGEEFGQRRFGWNRNVM